MPLEPWRFMTRSDVEAMWHENAQLRLQLQMRRRATIWLTASAVLAAVNLTVTAWMWLR